MKEGELLKKLHEMGCVFVKHCKKHDKYYQPATGKSDYVPRRLPRLHRIRSRTTRPTEQFTL